MYVLVTTMGIVEYERNKLRQKEIEVKALVALVNQNVNPSMRIDASIRLYEMAFPDKLAKKINRELGEYE